MGKTSQIEICIRQSAQELCSGGSQSKIWLGWISGSGDFGQRSAQWDLLAKECGKQLARSGWPAPEESQAFLELLEALWAKSGKNMKNFRQLHFFRDLLSRGLEESPAGARSALSWLCGLEKWRAGKLALEKSSGKRGGKDLRERILADFVWPRAGLPKQKQEALALGEAGGELGEAALARGYYVAALSGADGWALDNLLAMRQTEGFALASGALAENLAGGGRRLTFMGRSGPDESQAERLAQALLEKARPFKGQSEESLCRKALRAGNAGFVRAWLRLRGQQADEALAKEYSDWISAQFANGRGIGDEQSFGEAARFVLGMQAGPKSALAALRAVSLLCFGSEREAAKQTRDWFEAGKSQGERFFSFASSVDFWDLPASAMAGRAAAANWAAGRAKPASAAAWAHQACSSMPVWGDYGQTALSALLDGLRQAGAPWPFEDESCRLQRAPKGMDAQLESWLLASRALEAGGARPKAGAGRL